MYVICFNGPPYSGKDTLARLFKEHVETQGFPGRVLEVSLSDPLRKIAYAMVGLSYPDGMDYGAFKEKYFHVFGCSGRQLLIDVSERFIKPLYGQATLVQLMIDSIPEGFPEDGIVLVRDSGFQIEVDPIISIVGPRRVMVVRIHREGCTFMGDSREWVYHPVYSLDMDVQNNGTLDDLAVEAGRLFGRLVNQKGWTI